MNISFSHYQPTGSGYYLIKCDEISKLHLVLVIPQSGTSPQIITENDKTLFYHDFPRHFFWSEEINLSI